jgi:hypothetical protein
MAPGLGVSFRQDAAPGAEADVGRQCEQVDEQQDDSGQHDAAVKGFIDQPAGKTGQAGTKCGSE